MAVKQAKKDEKIKAFIAHNYKNYSEILRAREMQELDPDVSEKLPPLDSVKLFRNFTLSDMKRLSAMIDPVNSEIDYLLPDNIRYWPDFRRSLSMAEYARFAHEIGIHQKLQKVFSMPLGVNEITLGEISTAYQTILSGKVYKCKDGEWNEPCFIKEIRDRNGHVIFRNTVESKVVLDENITSQMGAMLRSVFTNGTARSQNSSIAVVSADGKTKLRYPVVGKTGTTNDYRNVAFMGGIPTYVYEKEGFALDSVIAVGSYVGFDNNKPLKSGKTRIAGASGGLPQWASFAKDEIEILKAPDMVDFYDISILATGEVPLQLANERGEITVDPMTGLYVTEAGTAGRPLPWLEVPGFIPPQVQEQAAESIAEMGIMTSLPMPAAAAVVESSASADAQANAPVGSESAHTTLDSIPAVQAAQVPAAPAAKRDSTPAPAAAPAAASAPAAPAPATAPAATPAPAEPKAAAMPKDDDWDLPENFNSKNAFVPIEVDTE